MRKRENKQITISIHRIATASQSRLSPTCAIRCEERSSSPGSIAEEPALGRALRSATGDPNRQGPKAVAILSSEASYSVSHPPGRSRTERGLALGVAHSNAFQRAPQCWRHRLGNCTAARPQMPSRAKLAIALAMVVALVVVRVMAIWRWRS